jgi:hypothetical protein
VPGSFTSASSESFAQDEVGHHHPLAVLCQERAHEGAVETLQDIQKVDIDVDRRQVTHADLAVDRCRPPVCGCLELPSG